MLSPPRAAYCQHPVSSHAVGRRGRRNLAATAIPDRTSKTTPSPFRDRALMPDPEGNVMFGSSTFRVNKLATRGDESWAAGPAYFRGDQVYHEGDPHRRHGLSHYCRYPPTAGAAHSLICLINR